jgi:hypothetical protein
VIGKDLDCTEVVTVQAALVGECAYDLTWLHLVALSHFDAIGSHRLVTLTGATLGSVLAIETLTGWAVFARVAVFTSWASATISTVASVAAIASAVSVITSTAVTAVCAVLTGLFFTRVALSPLVFCREKQRSIPLSHNSKCCGNICFWNIVVFDVVANNLAELENEVRLSESFSDGIVKTSQTCDVDVFHTRKLHLG